MCHRQRDFQAEGVQDMPKEMNLVPGMAVVSIRYIWDVTKLRRHRRIIKYPLRSSHLSLTPPAENSKKNDRCSLRSLMLNPVNM